MSLTQDYLKAQLWLCCTMLRRTPISQVSGNKQNPLEERASMLTLAKNMGPIPSLFKSFMSLTPGYLWT